MTTQQKAFLGIMAIVVFFLGVFWTIYENGQEKHPPDKQLTMESSESTSVLSEGSLDMNKITTRAKKIEPVQIFVAPSGEQVPVSPFMEIEQTDSIDSYADDTCYVTTEIWVAGKKGRALEEWLQYKVPCNQVEAMKAEQARRMLPKVEMLNSKLGMGNDSGRKEK